MLRRKIEDELELESLSLDEYKEQMSEFTQEELLQLRVSLILRETSDLSQKGRISTAKRPRISEFGS